MTLLPCEQQRIGKGVAEFDLDLLPLPMTCQNPECFRRATDRHHIVRRSHLGGPYAYVEIDGVVRPNLIALCVLCHQKVTLNNVKIWWDDGEWCWGSPGVSLNPPLGRAADSPGSGRPSEREHAHESPGPDSMLAGVEPREGSPGPGPGVHSHGLTEGGGDSVTPVAPGQSSVPDASLSVSPGETCPTCQRRVNHPPKADSPKSKTVSFRVPEDERESFDVLFADAAEHLGIAGHKYQKKTAIEYGLVLILQGPKGELID